MTVTFLIGNGFDLHMGMKTRYVDVYEGYIKSKSKNDTIVKFKNILKEDAPNEFTNWADFELKMGEITDKFDSEQQFVDCVRDFKEYLAKHLENEEKDFIIRISPQIESSISNEMKRSIVDFYSSLVHKDRSEINKLNPMVLKYSFVTFNYTSVFERLLSLVEFDLSESLRISISRAPLYLHGKIDTGIVLGVDSEKQLYAECGYSFTEKIKRAFLKPYFNNAYDPQAVHKISSAIYNSDVICVYGLSFGKSDLMWVEKIIEWLNADYKHHLVYFRYTNKKYDLWHRDLMMDIEDDYKDELLKRINYTNHDNMNDLLEQVHIPVGFDIFNIKEIIELDEQTKKNEEVKDRLVTSNKETTTS